MSVLRRVLVVLIVFAGALEAQADVLLSEVMYDLEGADAKREWVEVFNSGPDVQLLEGWRLFEGGVNHKLTIVAGSGTLPAGAYAIIADSAQDFLSDWPDFAGTLFDSAFSLSNTGETLVLRDGELLDHDSVTYSSESGAAGDGQSLHYNGTVWSTGTPSPGIGTLTSSGDVSEGGGEEASSGDGESESSPSFPVDPQIFAFAGVDRTVTVGADVLFNGRATGLSGAPLKNARFVWALGDGGRKEGESIRYHYRYPGVYVVVLDVASDEYSASDRLYVTAKEAELSFGTVSLERIEIKNRSAEEIDMSWWMLRSGAQAFTFPEHTILRSNSSVAFPSSITGLAPPAPDAVALLYPNGIVVSMKHEKLPAHAAPAAGAPRGTSIIGMPVAQRSIESRSTAATEVGMPAEAHIASVGQVAATAAALPAEQGARPVLPFAFGAFGIIALGVISALLLRAESRKEITIVE